MRALIVSFLFVGVSHAQTQVCVGVIQNGDFGLSIQADELTNGWLLSGVSCGDGPFWGPTLGRDGGGVYLNSCGRLDTDPCIATTITGLCPNVLYRITLQAYSLGDYSSSQNDSFAVSINNQTMLTQNDEPLNVWRNLQFTFVATDNVAQLKICAETNGSDCAFRVDNVQITRLCQSDFNNDGSVDGDDVIAFFERWDFGC